MSNLSAPITLTVPVVAGLEARDVACSYWDPAKSAYSNKGTVVLGMRFETGSHATPQLHVLCGVTHLTDFVTQVSSFVPKMNSLYLAPDVLLFSYDYTTFGGPTPRRF